MLSQQERIEVDVSLIQIHFLFTAMNIFRLIGEHPLSPSSGPTLTNVSVRRPIASRVDINIASQNPSNALM